MGNFKKKVEKKLKLRQAAFDSIHESKRAGFKRPGSLNPHKQRPNGSGGPGKKR